MWGVGLRQLARNPGGLTETDEVMGDVLATIVGTNGLDAVRALQFYYGLEVSKLSKSFLFLFEEENPSKPAKVVYDRKYVS